MPGSSIDIHHRNHIIHCRFYTPSKESKEEKGGRYPVIIICHGFLSRSMHLYPFARYFLKKGFAVFMFDFYAHGKSSGTKNDMSIDMQVSQLGCVVDHVRKSDRVSNIGLFGMSLGGMTSAIYASKDISIKSLVLLNPVVDFTDAFKNILKKDNVDAWKSKGHEVFRPHLSFRKYFVRKDFLLEGEQIDMMHVAESIHCPCMILQSGKDRKVSPDHSMRFYYRLGCIKEFHILHNAGHEVLDIRSYFRISRLSTAWFDKTLHRSLD